MPHGERMAETQPRDDAGFDLSRAWQNIVETATPPFVAARARSGFDDAPPQPQPHSLLDAIRRIIAEEVAAALDRRGLTADPRYEDPAPRA